MSPTEPTAPAAQIHKGLEGVIADETQISDVDGQHCQLDHLTIYRDLLLE